MTHQYMPNIFHRPHKNPLAPPPPYLMHGPLANFCLYDYGANVSEAVQKIAIDQNDYHKFSSCVIACWIAIIQ